MTVEVLDYISIESMHCMSKVEVNNICIMSLNNDDLILNFKFEFLSHAPL